MEDKRLLIIRLGATLPSLRTNHGDFDEWIFRETTLPSERVTVVSVHEGELLPPPETVAGAILSGSHAMVTDRAEWSVRTARWLLSAAAAGIPVLGICYGHQLIAEALGGRADFNPQGPEFGTTTIRTTAAAATDSLFSGLPETFVAHVSHFQSAITLPPGATRLAHSAGERHQAFAIEDRIWGVQFHPEFDETVMRAYLNDQAAALAQIRIDAAKRCAEVAPTPAATSLLAQFARIVFSR